MLSRYDGQVKKKGSLGSPNAVHDYYAADDASLEILNLKPFCLSR
jgi:hypothetical protein